MVVLEVPGTITATTTEQDIFPPTAPLVPTSYMFRIFTDNVSTGDVFIVKIYVRDPVANLYKFSDDFLIVSKIPSNDPADFKKVITVPYETTSGLKITLKKLAGLDQSLNWARYDI